LAKYKNVKETLCRNERMKKEKEGREGKGKKGERSKGKKEEEKEGEGREGGRKRKKQASNEIQRSNPCPSHSQTTSRYYRTQTSR
jgi:hypothetical protein